MLGRQRLLLVRLLMKTQRDPELIVAQELSMPSISYKSITVLLTLVLGLLILTSCSKGSNEQGNGGFPPPQVSVAEVIVRDVIPWNEFSGRIEAKESVQLRPRVGGVIEEIRYREGDIVKKGDLLFVIDQHPFRTELNRAEADLARARAQEDLAKAEIQRARNLIERKLLSQDEYDQRIAAENQASANVRSAEATAQLARLNLEYTEVRSPIDGRAGRALITKGNLVVSDPTPDLLTTIVSLDPMYVYFDSDEQTYLRYIKAVRRMPSDEDHTNPPSVFIGLANEEGFPHQGYVDFVDNQVDPNTGTIRIRAVLENKDYQLTPGLFARVKLLANDTRQAILIDDQAILTDQDRKYVYVLGPGNTAMRRNIKIGQTVKNFRIVTEGLQAGDRIIVHGLQKIFFPGMPVMPQPIQMGDPPPAPPAPPTAENKH